MDTFFSFLVLLGTFPTAHAFGQVVQLPTLGTFSISGGALVPDSGGAYLGGHGRGNSGSARYPAATASGQTRSATGASIHATIIDLDELDRMIRSQTQPKQTQLAITPSKVQANSLRTKASYEVPPSYAYLMAMSHTPVDDRKAIDDAQYYLNLADEARRKQRWSSVEMYYTQAWKALPEGRRDNAMKALLEAREAAIVAEQHKGEASKPSSSR
ncbi:hypothetical protein [Pirellula sp. SH-Sr6A]|uniref:hypothetical protein n=1 Tax=Pirellula sp. SH-Sr6A TaxID=1632865 RepID=UPI00143C0133|nr:hypothetical protein [Pirellula sp. SH-Sr6A]